MIYSFQVLQLICGTHFELPHACYMPRPYHPHWFNHGNNILWRVQIMKLVVNNFLQLPLRSKPRPLYLALYVCMLCMYVCCVCRWTMSLNCGHWQAYCSSRRWYVCLESRGGMILTGETEELVGKPVPVPLCPPQTPHGLTRKRTRASATRSQLLTAWATSWPFSECKYYTSS
jgi:hypothetical protein